MSGVSRLTLFLAMFFAFAALAVSATTLRAMRDRKPDELAGTVQGQALAIGDLEDRLEAVEAALEGLRRSSAAPLPQPVSVADRQAALQLVEQSIPTVTDRIDVRGLPENAGFEFTFTLTNTSGVVLRCETPLVEMTRNDYPPSDANPNLVEGKSAGEVGLLAPGASYQTKWRTTDLKNTTWMQFSGACTPLEARMTEMRSVATQTGIALDESLMTVRYGSWTSSRTARE